MIGLELVAGYLLAWAVRKARRLGGQADAEIDFVMDQGMERLHNLVRAKLGKNRDLDQIEADGANSIGNVQLLNSLNTAVAEAAAGDQRFARELKDQLNELQQVMAPDKVMDKMTIRAEAKDQARVAIQMYGIQMNQFGRTEND